MNSILNYFNCGKLYEKSIARYVVQKTTDINEKIIPFLKEYPGPPWESSRVKRIGFHPFYANSGINEGKGSFN